MNWSTDGQTPEYLAITRMVSLAPRIVDEILGCVPLEPGMRVLDVGCGSGEYAFRLGNAVSGVHFVGLDFDENFIELANARAASGDGGATIEGVEYEPLNRANTYEFVQGDGMHLPFKTGEFDAVISHTYLTAMPDYQTALAEMIRVCKAGGIVSSITNMSNNFGGTGLAFELFAPLLDAKTLEVVQRVKRLRETRMKYIDMGSGVPTYKVQRLFAHLLLEDVSARPLSQYFCLSDAQTSMEDYLRYVDLLRTIEVKRVERMRTMEEFEDDMSPEDWELYLEAIDKRYEGLVGTVGENPEWTWYGNTSLLVWGRVPDQDLAHFLENATEDRRLSDEIRAQAKRDGIEISERYAQAGPGRVCNIELEILPKGQVIWHEKDNSNSNEGEPGDKAQKSPDGKNAFEAKIAKALDETAAEKGVDFSGGQRKQSKTDKAKKACKGKKDRAGKKGKDTKKVYASEFSTALALEEAYAIASGADKKQRKQCAKAEKRAWALVQKGRKPEKLADMHIYCIDMMWDSVAETIEQGYKVDFFEIPDKGAKGKGKGKGKKDKKPLGMPVILVKVAGKGRVMQGICAHPDLTIATRRAFSRAVAQLCPPFM